MDTATEQRNRLMELVRQGELAIKELRAVTLRLEIEAEALLPAAVDEHADAPKVRKISYNNLDSETRDEIIEARHPMSQLAQMRGKRACSICRKPGHRATTCPEGK